MDCNAVFHDGIAPDHRAVASHHPRKTERTIAHDVVRFIFCPVDNPINWLGMGIFTI
jgi:hypothetical protein